MDGPSLHNHTYSDIIRHEYVRLMVVFKIRRGALLDTIEPTGSWRSALVHSQSLEFFAATRINTLSLLFLSSSLALMHSAARISHRSAHIIIYFHCYFRRCHYCVDFVPISYDRQVVGKPTTNLGCGLHARKRGASDLPSSSSGQRAREGLRDEVSPHAADNDNNYAPDDNGIISK